MTIPFLWILLCFKLCQTQGKQKEISAVQVNTRVSLAEFFPIYAHQLMVGNDDPPPVSADVHFSWYLVPFWLQVLYNCPPMPLQSDRTQDKWIISAMGTDCFIIEIPWPCLVLWPTRTLLPTSLGLTWTTAWQWAICYQKPTYPKATLQLFSILLLLSNFKI